MRNRHVTQHNAAELVEGRARRASGWARLLAGASLGAAALALSVAPQPARAQAVNGTPTPVFGVGSVVNGANTTTVNVNAQDALIDWSADSQTWIPATGTLTFQGSSGSYTALNRITAGAALNQTLTIAGSVQSDFGGKIWFYSPAGWIVGNGATIDVGGLVLTSNPIGVNSANPDGQKFLGANGQIAFGQAVAGSSVTVQNGATINAFNSNSYVALVAPRVVQAGEVTGNGSTAYIAADAVDLTVNNGLFDIVVSAGTADSQGIVHTGTTTGTVFGGGNNTQYLVAVPKNDVLTMLVTGNLGYNVASSGGISGGKIVLSAGYDVANGSADRDGGAPRASATLTNLTLNSETVASATDAIDVSATANSVFASGSLALDAGKRIGLAVNGANNRIEVGGPLTAISRTGGQGGAITLDVGGGGRLSVGDGLQLDARGVGAVQRDADTGALIPGAVGENARGGTIAVTLGTGLYEVGGTTELFAGASGGIGGASAGSVTGGTIGFSVGAQTQFNSDQSLDLVANVDVDGAPSVPRATAGASATGGSIALSFATGITGTISASAFAGATPGTNNAAQSATSGTIGIAFTGGDSTLDAINATVQAVGVGTGVVTGRDLTMSVTGAQVDVDQSLLLRSFLTGAVGTPGTVGLNVTNGGALSYTPSSSFASVNLSSSADGFDGINARAAAVAVTLDGGTLTTPGLSLTSSTDGGAGALGTGGDISLAIRNGGVLNGGAFVELNSRAFGGFGEDAGDGTGGTVNLSVAQGSLETDELLLTSNGFAGRGSDESVRIGAGRGGTIAMSLGNPNASVIVDSLSLTAFGGTGGRGEARGAGPAPGDGGNGFGGTVSLTVSGGTLTADTADISADGAGGDAFNGFANATVGGARGGAGEGGTATVAIGGGTVTLGTLDVRAAGIGGEGAEGGLVFDENEDTASAAPGDGGAGKGGGATLTLTGGSLTTSALAVTASGNQPSVFFFGEGQSFTEYYGVGGYATEDGTTAGVGGAGTGGTARVTIDGGSLIDAGGRSPLEVRVEALGFGGPGGATGSVSIGTASAGDGGFGKGGDAAFEFLGGGNDALSVVVSARGQGGDSAVAEEDFGSFAPFAALGAYGYGAGGSLGGDGGNGEGGTATVTIGADLDRTTSDDAVRSFTIDALGEGGTGFEGDSAGNGGSGTGGTATLAITDATVAIDNLSLNARGTGQSGTDAGLGNVGGRGGDGTGGVAEISVSGPSASLALRNGAVDARGSAGDGGTGGDNPSSGSAGDGGAGGKGVGGTVRLAAADGATFDFSQRSEFDLFATGSGGDGGEGGNAELNEGTTVGDGGNGGEGRGGTLEFIAADATLLLGDANFAVGGFGGDGGGRITGEGQVTDASRGGSGGDGFGGNVTLRAEGAAGALRADSLALEVGGTGGNGADGEGYDPTTFVGAAGGNGAAGTGGTIRLDALEGGTLTVAPGEEPSSLIASANAGVGGFGANGATNPTTGNGGAGGVGGNSGQGDGGNVILNAAGGLIETGDLVVQVNGFGQAGAQGGNGAPGIVPSGSPEGTPRGTDGAFGGFGGDGAGVGGTVEIVASTTEGGAVGGLDLGAVSLDLKGFIVDGESQRTDAAGQASITDTVDEDNGGVRFDSLDVDAFGSNRLRPVSLTISSSDDPIRIDGDFTAETAGAIDIVGIRNGGLDIGNTLELRTPSRISVSAAQGGLVSAGDITLDAGLIFIAANGCDGPLCRVVEADGVFDGFTSGDFILRGPALVAAGSQLSVRADGEITGDEGSGYAASSIAISGGNDVAIRNASGGSFFAESGLVRGEGDFYASGSLTLGEEAGGGVFDFANDFRAFAATDLDVTGQTAVTSGDSLRFAAGDDIRIGADATVRNETGGSEPGSLVLDAGSSSIGNPQPAGNVASLLIGAGALVDGTGGSVILTGGAIDGRDARFAGADFTADVRNPPASEAPQGNDGGQLSAPCLEGDICLGAIAATGAVRIGQSEDTPVRFTGTGDIAGDSVAIASRDTLTYGATGSALAILANGAVSLTSLQSDVALLGGAQVQASTIALSAAGSVTGDGNLVADGDVGIDVGDSITLTSLAAGGGLTTVAGIGGDGGLYQVPGGLSVGTFAVNADTAIAAGGSIAIGSTTTGGNDLALAADGPLSLGASADIADLTLDAQTVSFGALAAQGDIALTAATAISGTSAQAGGALSANGATLQANTLTSGGAMTLATTGATTLGSASAGAGLSSTSSALQFAGLTAAGNIALTTGTATGGNATSTAGAVSLNATGAATLGQVRAATDITARATTLNFTGMTAGRDISLDVTTLGGNALSAGRDLAIRSVNDLAFGTIAAGRNLALTASNGAITVNTDIDAGGTVSLAGDAILVRAAGPLSVASVSADNGDIAITTDGLLTVANAIAIGDVTLTSTANSLILGPVAGGRGAQSAEAVNAGGTSRGTPGPGAITLTAAQSITMQGTVDAQTALTATAGTTIDQRALAVGRTIAYRSADIVLGQNAALGQNAFTTGIALTNSGSAGAFLGDGPATGSGYRLDNAEFGRIRSGGDVTLAGGSSLSVGTLAATAGATGNIGANATLGLSTSGELAVGGALGLAGAAGNTLRLAGATVSVDAATGSVRLSEGTARGGTLAIVGNLLAVTSAARSALTALTSAQIDARLAENDGVTDGRTLLEAGALTIDAGGRILIQNTALGQTFDERRGFAVDSIRITTGSTTSGSTTETTTGSAPLIVINGTVGLLTGLDALRAVQVSGGFDEFWTVNGCRLLTASCGTPQIDPIQDVIEEEIDQGANLDGTTGEFGLNNLIQIVRIEPTGFETVIDEPVTGSGNDDFLVSEAAGDQECTADDGTKCDKPPEGDRK